jgi:hypothetical protein
MATISKAKESFDDGVFFYIKAKRTPSIVSKLFLSQVNTFDRTSEAKTLYRKKIIFEAKRTPPSVSKLFSK